MFLRNSVEREMIIFDLDGTLADCEHRRHFVDPNENPHVKHGIPGRPKPGVNILRDYDERTGEIWNPDWKSFYEACDQDKPIEPVIDIFEQYWKESKEINIWSGRCESVRDKTIAWLANKIEITHFRPKEWFDSILKMRPIGYYTPDDELKEKWLDEFLESGGTVDYVFDGRPKVVRMWRRRGIFVFDVNQTGAEF
jgi:hypothetical protein